MASIGPSRYAVAAWPSHAESDRCGVITCLDINHRRNRHQHHHISIWLFLYMRHYSSHTNWWHRQLYEDPPNRRRQIYNYEYCEGSKVCICNFNAGFIENERNHVELWRFNFCINARVKLLIRVEAWTRVRTKISSRERILTKILKKQFDEERQERKLKKVFEERIEGRSLQGSIEPFHIYSNMFFKNLNNKPSQNTSNSVTASLAESCAVLWKIYKNEWNSMKMPC